MQINKLLGIVGRDILIKWYSLLEVLAAMPWFDNQRGSWCLLPSAPQIAQGELDHGASGSEYQRSGSVSA
jgi:hypothetical protein